MKKSIKYLIIKILSVLTAVSALCFFACSKENGNQPATLDFNVTAETTIGYYEYCEVPSVVAKDSVGNIYFPAREVKAPDGTTVVIEEGKFFVLQDGEYVFNYTVEFNDETVTKNTVAKVVDRLAPEFDSVMPDITVFCGETVKTPEVEYSDNKDAKEQIQFKTTVKYENEEVALFDGEFTADKAGTYVIEYVATDRAQNSASMTVRVNSVKKQDGEIAYFYENGCTELCSLINQFTTEFSVSEAANYPLGNGGKSLKVTETAGFIYGGVTLQNPAVKDISGYRYFYIDVYNPQDQPVTFWMNFVYDIPCIDIAPKTWTRVVAVKNGNNFDMTRVTSKISDTGDGSKDIFYPGETGGLPNPSATDISRINVGLNNAEYKTIYLGQMRAVNELPELPSGIVYATATKATLKIGGVVTINTTHKVEYELEDAVLSELSVTVSVNGGEETPVTVNSDFAFDTEGEYKFIATITRNGSVVGRTEKIVTCTDPKGRIIGCNEENVVEMNGLKAFASYSVYTVNGDVVNRSDLSYATVMCGSDSAWAGMTIATPNVKDVSSYRYIYVDVYCGECDFNFMLNYQWGSPYVTVKKGEWKRIVLKNDGNGDFVMPDKSGNQGGGDTSKVFNGYLGEYSTNLQLTDITGVSLFATTDAGWRHVAVGAFVACNELPTLPDSVTYANYTPESENSTVVNGEGVLWRKEW